MNRGSHLVLVSEWSMCFVSAPNINTHSTIGYRTNSWASCSLHIASGRKFPGRK